MTQLEVAISPPQIMPPPERTLCHSAESENNKVRRIANLYSCLLIHSFIPFFLGVLLPLLLLLEYIFLSEEKSTTAVWRPFFPSYLDWKQTIYISESSIDGAHHGQRKPERALHGPLCSLLPRSPLQPSRIPPDSTRSLGSRSITRELWNG